MERIYREQLISLCTTSAQIESMLHEIKNSLYQTRNTSYLPAPCTINDVNIEGIWSKGLNGEEFILYNSIHPIFRTLEPLEQLSKSDNEHLFFLMEGLNHAQIHSINYLGDTKSIDIHIMPWLSGYVVRHVSTRYCVQTSVSPSME